MERRSFLKVAGLTSSMILPELMLTRAVLQKEQTETEKNESDSNLERLLLLADIHIGKKDANKRQANTLAASVLEKRVDELRDRDFDFVIQLGDLIREVDDHEANAESFRVGLETIERLPFPAIHLLGNHDLWGLSMPEVEKICLDLSISQDFFGHKDLTHHQIVWLDLIAEKNRHGRLSPDRVDWLRSVVDPKKPIIIFSHYGILPQNSKGNYYFEDNSAATALTNGPQVWRAIKDLPIQAIVNGHVHWAGYGKVGKTHMITIPSFTENIGSDHRFNPGMYSVLELSERRIVVKTFLGEFALSSQVLE